MFFLFAVIKVVKLLVVIVIIILLKAWIIVVIIVVVVFLAVMVFLVVIIVIIFLAMVMVKLQYIVCKQKEVVWTGCLRNSYIFLKKRMSSRDGKHTFFDRKGGQPDTSISAGSR